MKALTHQFKWAHDEFTMDEAGEISAMEVAEKHSFIMTHGSHRVFEEMFGQPFMAFITAIAELDGSADPANQKISPEMIASLISSGLVRNLAAACWIDTSSGMKQSRETALMFADMSVYDVLSDDLEFVGSLLEMAIANASVETNAKTNAKSGSAGSKKKNGR